MIQEVKDVQQRLSRVLFTSQDNLNVTKCGEENIKNDGKKNNGLRVDSKYAKYKKTKVDQDGANMGDASMASPILLVSTSVQECSRLLPRRVVIPRSRSGPLATQKISQITGKASLT